MWHLLFFFSGVQHILPQIHILACTNQNVYIKLKINRNRDERVVERLFCKRVLAAVAVACRQRAHL